ncbi:MAG: acyl-CoA synthetase [Pseudomonadota bacterium]
MDGLQGGPKTAGLSDRPIRNLADIEAFEREMPFEARVSARGVFDVFRESAEKYPDHIAMTMVMTGAPDETPRKVSYRELLQGVIRAANVFTDIAGDAPGVAYMLPNLVETHFVLWGAETVGYAVPINFLLRPEHIAELVQASGAKVLVALGPHPQLDIWEKAVAVAAALPGVKLVQVAPPTQAAPDGVINLAAALQGQPGDVLKAKTVRRDDEVAAYFHTGGTTGAPKLVAHTHRNQLVAAFGGAVLLDYRDNDILTCGLPLFHVAGTIVCGLSVFMAGGNLLMLTPGGLRNPAVIKNFWKLVEAHRATILGGVPTALGALLNVPLDADISSARLSLVGASSTPRAVAEQFQALTNTTLHEILGMTETGGLIAIAPSAAKPVISSVGFRLPYTQVAIRKFNADGTLGAECSPNEIGVLTISGPTVTPGYRSGEAKAHRDGYLDSGDLAYADAEGRLYIAGRAKDLIIRSGHNIDPLMIEDVFQRHPAVEMAAAVGQPDRYAGELPVCYVSLRPGAQTSVEELRHFAEGEIAERPAWPKQIYIVDKIPVTGVGKIFKPELRADAAKRLVDQILAETFDVAGATVAATPGGKRGMLVEVTLPADMAWKKEQVEKALEGYVFEARVQ